MDEDVLEELLDRLLGVKVCLEEVLGIDGLKAEHQAAFEKALDAALEIEETLVAVAGEEAD